MVRAWAGMLGLLVMLAVLPSAALGQQRSCQQVLPADARRIVNAAGEEIVYFRDPVRVLCTGGIRLEADSAVMNRSAGTLELVGRVVYRDEENQLTSDWANYLSRTEELFARGNVVLTDLARGSVVRGDDFEYRRETEQRPEARTIMRGSRPHATLYPQGRESAADTVTPLQVRASRLETVGSLFLAQSDVEIERGDLRGAGDTAQFDQTAERMSLRGRAHVENDDYRLEGERIDAFLRGDDLTEVVAERRARLVSEDLRVNAERIRIGFLDGELERMEAWNPVGAVAEGGAPADAGRALAVARDFRLRADSIDARTEEGRLREVRAVGRAFGERDNADDSLDVALPEVIARDWIQGDTIIGYFRAAANGAGDGAVDNEEDDAPAALEVVAGTPVVGTVAADPEAAAEDELVLERIEVIGGESHALSLYRMLKEGQADPSVNFMRAQRIVLFMREGEVSRVEAEGPIEGLYLDPVRAARQPSTEPEPGETS
jgi:lipopolysaccharide export system protein LptA